MSNATNTAIASLDSRTLVAVVAACRTGYRFASLYAYDESIVHIHNIASAYKSGSLVDLAGALHALSAELAKTAGAWNGYTKVRDAATAVAALA